MNKVTAIVLAAGTGSRMQQNTKKQFMEINGKAIIWYTLNAFEHSGVDEIVLVTGADDIDYVKDNIVDENHFTKVTEIVAGGEERFQSVYNGLQVATGDIILIHDGARPLVTNMIINRCIDGAIEDKAVVAGMPAKDTIKIASADRVIKDTPERSTMWLTQTPQAFDAELIKRAYNRLIADGNDKVTDDAMVVEQYTDTRVKFVEGSYENIKITTPEDLVIAKALMESV